MHDLAVLMTFAGGLAGALVLGYLAYRLTLSPIVGYLLAGVLVGPFTPGFTADRAVAGQFAEIGVILLLFGIGLRFHLREMMAVWHVVVPGALIKSVLTMVATALVMRQVGWSWTPGLILGMAVSVASTVVLARVLAERHDLHSAIGHIAIGSTVVEDILTVIMLLILPIVFGRGTGGAGSAATALGLAGVKIAGLVCCVVVFGRWVVPAVMERIAQTRERELFTLTVLVVAVGIAVASARLFGVSMALGAFLAGLAVGRSEFAARAAGDAMPMRDAFAVLFFVSVGMLFDPRSLVESPALIVLVLLVVVAIKPLITVLTVCALRTPIAVAVPVGAAFAQVGEFSFILGSVARGLGLLNDAGWNALVAASIISIAVNPPLYGWARRLAAPSMALAPLPSEPRPAVDPNHTILVGYGPVGAIVEHLLTERGALVTVIDLNLDTIRRLRARGVTAVYGDVLRQGTLEEAGIATTGHLILSADVEDAAEIIRQARLLNPQLRILVRCTHLRDAATLRRAGAVLVAAGEAEVGVALAEAVTASDGMDHAAAADHREAVRAHLYDSASMLPPPLQGAGFET
jgi:monovalent cation:H+ antiporter-2, CPA2 family